MEFGYGPLIFYEGYIFFSTSTIGVMLTFMGYLLFKQLWHNEERTTSQIKRIKQAFHFHTYNHNFSFNRYFLWRE